MGLLIADHHKRDLSVFQVLLVSHVLVSRQQNLKACCLSNRYQLSINKPVPSAFIASTTIWPFRTYRSGAGVPLSKSMSIDHLRCRRDRNYVQASRREFDHRDHLFMRQMKPVHNLADRGTHFQIVENDRDGRPGVPKHPCTAALSGHAFHGGTLRPIENCHILILVSSYQLAGFTKPPACHILARDFISFLLLALRRIVRLGSFGNRLHFKQKESPPSFFDSFSRPGNVVLRWS